MGEIAFGFGDANLPQAGDENTKVIGSALASQPMSAESKDAWKALQATQTEEDWAFDESASSFSNQYFVKRLYLNANPEVPWGVAFYTYYGNNNLRDRSKLGLTFQVPEDGWYEMDVSAFFEQLADNNSLTGNYGGGKLNTIWLDAGEHTVHLQCTKAGNYYVGRLIFRATGDPNEMNVALRHPQK